MHLLDFILYFPCLGIFWYFLKWSSKGEFTEELGTLIGWFLSLIFTILYLILFSIYPDFNWIDIFNSPLPHIIFKL